MARTPKPAEQVIPLQTPSASYDITVGPGLLRTLHSRLEALMAGKSYRPFLVTSPEIWKHWSDAVRASFPEAASPTVLFLPPGEKNKRLKPVELLAEQLAKAGADRDSLLLAFGGGVVGDVTGFLAAIYMRGIPYVQLPTTVLAQVDSSVGGKTGVNLKAGKNLLGSFYHPLAVLADTSTLSTLPHRELHSGLQESVKAAIICDSKLFAYLEHNVGSLSNFDTSMLAHIIAASVRVKAAIVTQDEHESGVRMLLNFGHTLGHAIESATKYKALLHGEAVGWGSLAALRVGLARKTISQSDFNRMSALIHAFGPLPPFKAKAKRLVALTASDKKSRSGRRAFILPTGVGSAEVVYDVSDQELLIAAHAMLREVKATR